MKEEKELVELFKEHPVVSAIIESLNKVCKYNDKKLVGGAIIDILEGREPKDYDFIVKGFSVIAHLSEFNEEGFLFVSETSTAYTFTFNGHVVQFLKKKLEEFEFTISQSYLSFDYKDKMELSLNKYIFENKVLVPVSLDNWLSCLSRIPHWRKKGYSIDDTTYLALVNKAAKSSSKKLVINS